MGKTETSKKRKVDVYLISIGQKERWKRYAKSRGMSLSKMVQETVEGRMMGTLVPRGRCNQDLRKEHVELTEEYKRLKQQNIRLETHIELLEKERRRDQIIAHITDDDGFRMYDKELTDEIKRAKRPLSIKQILINIRLDPKDIAMYEGITKQLQGLLGYGLVKQTQKG
jgi:hypothetical protein